MRQSGVQSRHGTVLIAAIIVLSLMTIGVAISVTASGDDVRLAVFRADSIRAFYAAESGVHIAVRTIIDDPSAPATGLITLPSGSEIRFITSFASSPTPPGIAVIEGRHGVAVRRIEIEVE